MYQTIYRAMARCLAIVGGAGVRHDELACMYGEVSGAVGKCKVVHAVVCVEGDWRWEGRQQPAGEQGHRASLHMLSRRPAGSGQWPPLFYLCLTPACTHARTAGPGLVVVVAVLPPSTDMHVRLPLLAPPL
jgi:hypothetical protein